MDINQVVQLITNVGFPVVVCGYFALRLEKFLGGIEQVIKDNTLMLGACRERIDGLDG